MTCVRLGAAAGAGWCGGRSGVRHCSGCSDSWCSGWPVLSCHHVSAGHTHTSTPVTSTPPQSAARFSVKTVRVFSWREIEDERYSAYNLNLWWRALLVTISSRAGQCHQWAPAGWGNTFMLWLHFTQHLQSTGPPASTSLGYTLYKLGHVYYEGTAAGTRCSGGWPGVAPGGNVGIWDCMLHITDRSLAPAGCCAAAMWQYFYLVDTRPAK